MSFWRSAVAVAVVVRDQVAHLVSVRMLGYRVEKVVIVRPVGLRWQESEGRSCFPC